MVRRRFGKYNFRIFRAEEPDKCLGVAVYGYRKNPKAKIFTHPNPRAWMCGIEPHAGSTILSDTMQKAY